MTHTHEPHTPLAPCCELISSFRMGIAACGQCKQTVDSATLTFNIRGTQLCRLCYGRDTAARASYVQYGGDSLREIFRKCRRCKSELPPTADTSRTRVKAEHVSGKLGLPDAIRIPEGLFPAVPGYIAGDHYWCNSCKVRFRVRSPIELGVIVALLAWNTFAVAADLIPATVIGPALNWPLGIFFIGGPSLLILADIRRRLQFPALKD